MSCLSRQHIGTVNRPLCFCSSWRCHLDGRMGSQREGRVRNHRDRLFGVTWWKCGNGKSMKQYQLLIQKVFVSEHTPLVLMARRTDEKLELQWTLEGHQLGVVSVDISPNGAIAASSSLDAHIRLWDLETGKQIKSMDAGPGELLISFFLKILFNVRIKLKLN